MILETERLILRSFTENDAADAYEYLHEPMVHCFACMKTETMDDARKAVLDRAKDGEYYFAITLKENGKVIGEIDAMPEATAPDEDDPHLRVLESAHIDDNEYFSQMVHDDIDTIIRDIRAAHKHDSVSAPELSVAEQMKKDLEEVANFKGSKMERTVILYCKQLQIDYKKLTEEEFRALIQILRKSKLYIGGGRGKR